MQNPVTLARARSLVEETLGASRQAHVFAVAEKTGELCRTFALQEAQSDLICAALLHDITKEKGTEAQLQLCAEYDIIPSPDDLAAPKMLHAYTAAEFARRDFDLSDPFCDAIRFHTTGRADMTLYDKILFLADYIEKTRKHSACRQLRTLFYRKIRRAETPDARLFVLDECVLWGLDATLRELLETRRAIHRQTVDARNALLRCVEARKERTS